MAADVPRDERALAPARGEASAAQGRRNTTVGYAQHIGPRDYSFRGWALAVLSNAKAVWTSGS